MISIIIPAYNEEDRILTTLEKIEHYLQQTNKQAEIIVVDDGSTDSTVEAVQAYAKEKAQIHLIDKGRNDGKGYSIKVGMQKAQGDWLLFSDADLSTPIEELDKLLAANVDVALGSRALPESMITKKQPFYRIFMGKIFNKIVRLLAVRGIKDTQCGFKLFKKDIGKHLFSLTHVRRFGFDVEVLYLARKFSYTLKEIPVTWINDERSTVHPVKDAARMFFDLLKIRWHDIKGHYASSPTLSK